MSSPVPEPDVDPAAAVAVDGPKRGSALHWRTTLLLASAFVTVLVASATMLIRVPYVVLHPGPTINTLGKEGGHDLITVRGHPVYPAKGALDLTTVTIAGGPGMRLSMYSVFDGWLNDKLMVVPSGVLYPSGQTMENSREENQEEMASSQESASVSALRELGIGVGAKLVVHSVDQRTPPSPLKNRDEIVTVGGHRVADLNDLTAFMTGIKPGSTVQVTVRRDGSEQTLAAPTHSQQGRTILGIRVSTAFSLPFDITIRIGNVGGPSAGMMFALGVIDVLTPGDLTGGAHIAGTGTITENGEVGSIGGIQQKLVGAKNAGAQWFLTPVDNCQDIVGHVPDGLKAVSVKDLHDARLAVERIGSGRIGELTFCPATRHGPAPAARP